MALAATFPFVSALAILQEVAIGLAVAGAAFPAGGNHDSLVGAYVTLCSDRVWAVRKACADILPAMAKLATAEARQAQLLPVFDNFCEDVSHWVQNSALQQLGPFISTLEAHNIPKSELKLLRLGHGVCSLLLGKPWSMRSGAKGTCA